MILNSLKQIFSSSLFVAKRNAHLMLTIKCKESESESGDTPNDIISPGGSDGGEISPLNARVKRTWTHSHQTLQQRRQVNQGGHSSP